MATKRIRDEDVVASGRRTLEIESAALAAAAQRLNGTFAAAVRTLWQAKGKVVVTGLGKSGHVARKIAATLASTGTSACFLHPTEGLHGDIGMLVEKDVLIAIAFGGETREVVGVARFARRIGVPVIAITGRAQSTLASLATHLVDASVEKEACSLNLAPTSSSTVSLALGDALAVALMDARGFSHQEFAQLHPEGSLATKLSVVSEHLREYQTTDWLTRDEGFYNVLEKVTRHNFGIAPVVGDARELIGCVTDGDVRRAVLKLEAAVFSKCAGDLMAKNPKSVPADALAVDALRLMEENKVTALFVVDEGRPIGIVRLHDLLAAKVV